MISACLQAGESIGRSRAGVAACSAAAEFRMVDACSELERDDAVVGPLTNRARERERENTARPLPPPLSLLCELCGVGCVQQQQQQRNARSVGRCTRVGGGAAIREVNDFPPRAKG